MKSVWMIEMLIPESHKNGVNLEFGRSEMESTQARVNASSQESVYAFFTASFLCLTREFTNSREIALISSNATTGALRSVADPSNRRQPASATPA
jgi:hypothetical protein